MKNAQARTTYLKDYQPPAFLIETTDLSFDLYEDHARVESSLLLRRNDNENITPSDTLVLHGCKLVLERLALNGRELRETDYLIEEETLTIPSLSELLGGEPAEFELSCTTRLQPQNNTTLEGLFKSRTMFCTQCEAEGFRHITYYLDRPDVMSRFTTRIAADKALYPVLLSNGNRIASGDVEGDASRHWVSWEDPFKKPSYLFALVAGDLEHKDDAFITCSGREIKLQIYVEEKDLDKIDYAMTSLKNAMRWDEEVYGREYDLDIFMIVAVDDFNMGAMENKGLNIFNTSCVLANPATTTDFSFQRVEAVVAHEYFHNWSGNRVTCRDWFQLSLKEGFTVFRDSEFSADMGSRTVKRVDEVAFLKTVQFAEDGGPMAHSVRPDSYMEISNFYTVTIYEKGAEVVRMISNLLGPENFRKGSDLYFSRHDGQAVTTEDFVKAMEDASGVDLKQFRRWYSQAGTPVLAVTDSYDAEAQEYELVVRQSCPPTPGQAKKEPLHIPLRLGLLRADGSEYPLRLRDESSTESATDRVFDITEAEQRLVFTGIEAPPVPSLLRSFSAPVRLKFDYSAEQLNFLMVNDSDGFNRWQAGQDLAIQVMDEMQAQRREGSEQQVPDLLIQACTGVLQALKKDPAMDLAMVAHLLTLPAEGFLIERAGVADVDAIHEVRDRVANAIAAALQAEFADLYERHAQQGEFAADAAAMAQRALRNCALAYLVRTGSEEWLDRCQQQFRSANNMTDKMAALRALAYSKAEKGIIYAEQALEEFYEQWQHEALVVDQWFITQALRPHADTLDKVKRLLSHKAFSLKNPNKVRSLIGAFCGQNHVNFHKLDGSGYEFLADRVLELDALNPQVAARLLTPLTRWKKYCSERQALMQAQLQRIKSAGDLSRDVFEVVEKSTV